MVETCHQRVKGKITDDNCDSPTILAFSSLQWLTPLLNRVHVITLNSIHSIHSILSGQNWKSAIISQRGLLTDINFPAVKDDHCSGH